MNTNRVSKLRAKWGLLSLILLTPLMLVVIYNRQVIKEAWHQHAYKPPSEIAQLATDAGMSDEGKRLFYLADPMFASETEIETKCTTHNLGCITPEGKIYILEPAITGYDTAVVTAAHEMLHVAYFRLEPNEANQVKEWLNNYIKEEPEILKLVINYQEPGVYYDEAHAIVGSEQTNLGRQLEEHYARYFSDRSKATQAYFKSRQE